MTAPYGYPEEFWAEAAADLHWYKPWDPGTRRHEARRFIAGSKAAKLNTCYNALDVHVENGNADTDSTRLRQSGHRNSSGRLRTASCATIPPDLPARLLKAACRKAIPY